MNSQDITRALIDTTVARAMVEMDADPKRSVRKLCDLGRQFSRGVPGQIQIACQRNAIAVVEVYFLPGDGIPHLEGISGIF